jgi:hypothetical protein
MTGTTIRSNFNYGRTASRSPLASAFSSQMPPARQAPPYQAAPGQQQGGQPGGAGPFQSGWGAQSPGGFQYGQSALSQALSEGFGPSTYGAGSRAVGGGRYVSGGTSGVPEGVARQAQKPAEQQRADVAKWQQAVASLGARPAAGSPAFRDYQARYNQAFRDYSRDTLGQPLRPNFSAWA